MKLQIGDIEYLLTENKITSPSLKIVKNGETGYGYLSIVKRSSPTLKVNNFYLAQPTRTYELTLTHVYFSSITKNIKVYSDEVDISNLKSIKIKSKNITFAIGVVTVENFDTAINEPYLKIGMKVPTTFDYYIYKDIPEQDIFLPLTFGAFSNFDIEGKDCKVRLLFYTGEWFSGGFTGNYNLKESNVVLEVTEYI